MPAAKNCVIFRVMDVLEIIKDCRIVPVVKIDDAEKAVPLAKALLAGGIPIIEITYRTQAAQASIAKIVKACPQMTVGAGTVISPELAKSAVLAGASFLVSPGSNDATIEWASKHNIPVIPGVATPTEIESALMKGINVLKLFPAEVLGGVRLVDALKGPFPQVQFLPTGGVSEDNAASYLHRSNVIAVGGTWMVKSELIESENWEEITKLCRKACASRNA